MTSVSSVDYLVIHHSKSSRDSTTVEDIRSWHLERGWNDIGYHFVIEGDGALKYGRPVPRVGAHAPPKNRVSLGVCLVGNNTVETERWSLHQIRTAQILLSCMKTIWPKAKIVGHRDIKDTLCPAVDQEVFEAIFNGE